MKFEKLALKFLDYAKKNTKRRTFICYQNLYHTHLESEFAKRKITDIKSDEWLHFFTNKKQTLSFNSLKLLYSVVKSIYKHSQLNFNVTIRFTNINYKAKVKRVDAISKKEQLQIEKYILNNKLYYHYGIIIALYTGLRIGELLALTWQDVDLKAKTIDVSKIVYSVTENHKTNTYIDSPKTEEGNRVISIPQKLVPIFKELKEYQKNSSQFVISRATGKQIKVRVYQQSFTNLLKKINLKHHGFHSLRHTFATRAMECGGNMKTLSAILGHSDVTVTLKSYVHSSMEQKSKLMNRVCRTI